MPVLKPTIGQTQLEGDKESKLKNGKEMFRVKSEMCYQLELVLVFSQQ